MPESKYLFKSHVNVPGPAFDLTRALYHIYIVDTLNSLKGMSSQNYGLVKGDVQAKLRVGSNEIL